MKKLIFSALILLSISLVVQAEDYYWYMGNKIPLPHYGNQYYIIYMADALLESDKEKIEYCEDVYYPEIQNLKWGLTKPNTVIEDKEHVLYQTLSYTSDDCDHDTFVTHRFYVKLKDGNDLETLQNMAAQYYAEIDEESDLQFWYILRCKLNSEYNALELANLFYESGLYSAAEPEFMGGMCYTLEGTSQILSDKLPKFSKILHNGQILILRGDKTYTLQGQEVK